MCAATPMATCTKPCKACCAAAMPSAACCARRNSSSCSRKIRSASSPPPWCRSSSTASRVCSPSAVSTRNISAARSAPCSSPISVKCWRVAWPTCCATTIASRHVVHKAYDIAFAVRAVAHPKSWLCKHPVHACCATVLQKRPVQEGSPMSDPLHADIDAFIHHLVTERRLSPHTQENYRRDLQQCAALLTQRRLDQWHAVTSNDVRMLVATLHRQGKGGKSIQRMLSSIRTFYRWLMREGRARVNPADGIRAPKSGRRLPKALDADQVNSLLNHPHSDDPLVLRDQALME